MTRPKTPNGAKSQSKYANGDKVWVFSEVKWEDGTILGLGGSSESSGRYKVALDADKSNSLVFEISNIRKK